MTGAKQAKKERDKSRQERQFFIFHLFLFQWHSRCFMCFSLWIIFDCMTFHMSKQLRHGKKKVRKKLNHEPDSFSTFFCSSDTASVLYAFHYELFSMTRVCIWAITCVTDTKKVRRKLNHEQTVIFHFFCSSDTPSSLYAFHHQSFFIIAVFVCFATCVTGIEKPEKSSITARAISHFPLFLFQWHTI